MDERPEHVVVELEVGGLLLEDERVGREQLDQPVRVRVAVEVDEVPGEEAV